MDAVDAPQRADRLKGVQDAAVSPPLSVSPCPPSGSLLGRRARQLSRNMSDGLYDDEDEPLESSQSNTSSGCHCGEAPPTATASEAQAEAQSCDHCESCDQQGASEGLRRLQDLHIMDYNELPDLS